MDCDANDRFAQLVTGTFKGPTLSLCDSGIGCKTSFKDGAWIPLATGETLYFSGLSSTFIGDAVLWSFLKTSGGQVIRFESAAFRGSSESTFISNPIPPALVLLLSGIAGLGVVGWRRKASSEPVQV